MLVSPMVLYVFGPTVESTPCRLIIASGASSTVAASVEKKKKPRCAGAGSFERIISRSQNGALPLEPIRQKQDYPGKRPQTVWRGKEKHTAPLVVMMMIMMMRMR